MVAAGCSPRRWGLPPHPTPPPPAVHRVTTPTAVGPHVPPLSVLGGVDAGVQRLDKGTMRDTLRSTRRSAAVTGCRCRPQRRTPARPPPPHPTSHPTDTSTARARAAATSRELPTTSGRRRWAPRDHRWLAVAVAVVLPLPLLPPPPPQPPLPSLPPLARPTWPTTCRWRVSPTCHRRRGPPQRPAGGRRPTPWRPRRQHTHRRLRRSLSHLPRRVGRAFVASAVM